MGLEQLHEADIHTFKDGDYGLTCIRIVARHFIVTRHHDGVSVHVTGDKAAELNRTLESVYLTAAQRGLRSTFEEPSITARSMAAYRIIDQIYIHPVFDADAEPQPVTDEAAHIRTAAAALA